jgi:predicted PurR-regulated permease PerM
MKEVRKIEISWSTIFKILVAVLIVYFLYSLKEIFLWFLFSLILSFLATPAIEFFERKKIPRVFATFLVYFLVLGTFALLIFFISNSLADELQNLVKFLPSYLTEVKKWFEKLPFGNFRLVEVFEKNLQEALEPMAKNIFRFLMTIFGGVFTIFTIFFLSFFFSLEEKKVKNAIRSFFPKEAEAILGLWQKIQVQVSGWFFSRILGCLLVWFLTYLSLFLFKVDYAFSLSLFAGMTNLVPILGPILAGFVIFIFALLESWWQAVFSLVAFILIQQIEGTIFLPILTQRFVGLSPLLVLLSLIIGGKLLGILGAILAIPFTAVLKEIVLIFLKREDEFEAG